MEEGRCNLLTSILLSSESLSVTVVSWRLVVDICASDPVVSFKDLLKDDVDASADGVGA